ncbi:MAG: UPF0149 family protein [Rubrivivax sp.]
MRDLSDTEVARLQALLDELAAAAPARSPLDVSALDGFLCGVALQPQPVPKARWWPFVLDAEGRAPTAATAAAPPPARQALAAIETFANRRHEVLAEAIAARRWFDPWIFEFADGDDGSAGAGRSSGSSVDDDGATLPPCATACCPGWAASRWRPSSSRSFCSTTPLRSPSRWRCCTSTSTPPTSKGSKTSRNSRRPWTRSSRRPT